MRFEPLFEVGWCMSYLEADYRVPCKSMEFIEKHRPELADMLEFMAKQMRSGEAPFRSCSDANPKAQEGKEKPCE